MTPLKTTTALVTVLSSLAFSVGYAEAAPITYQLTGNFVYGSSDPVSPGANGQVDVTVTYDLGAAYISKSDPQAATFALDAFSVAFTGGRLDGYGFTDGGASVSEFHQFAFFSPYSTTFRFTDADHSALTRVEFELSFESLLTDVDVAAEIDTAGFLFGRGYSVLNGVYPSLIFDSGTAAVVSRSVPEPGGIGLTVLTLGGAALLRAAKKRRAEQRRAEKSGAGQPKPAAA